MTIQEAKEFLKNEYLKVGLKLDKETLDTLFFSYDEGKIKISKEDIEKYRDFTNSKNKYHTKPSECSLVNKNYREQFVSFISFRSRFSRRNNFIFGNSDSGETYLEISQASDNYINYFRFQEQYLELCLPRLSWSGDEDEEDPYDELFENLYRPITIKVFNINEKNIDNAILKSSDLIDRCLFSVSSLKEKPVELIDDWPIRKKNKRDSRNFEYGEQFKGNTLPIPNLTLNSVLIRFHQQATSTDITSLKYLAYYQILEYFFLSVADEQLYNNLSRRINDLKFNTTASNLDKIIKDVTNHKRINDETEMLKNVLKKYVQEDELIDFINKYELHLDKKHYTVKREIFGIPISATSLNSGHVYGNISKTIKAIRNALVHSSDRHERNDRYIPYSKEGTQLIQDEIPLIKFLAEKVIISSASMK